SGGNTGALMALGRSILGTFHGVDRPAITKLFPSQNGGTLVLDLGANVDSSAEQLMQFALMGQILAQVIKEKEQADVALLNVGDENIKGNELVRLADSLIREAPEINYIGFAEGGDIFRGKADVLVCDGFVGNIALKSAEGAANIILDGVKAFFERSWFTRLLAKLLAPHMASALKQLDPDTHNGAMFLGLNGVVVKSHGNAKVEAFVHAIELADREARSNLPEKINKALEFIAFD
ncbi:phosphate acyltransferase PlsX, partial [Oleiphilus sp. HI0067]